MIAVMEELLTLPSEEAMCRGLADFLGLERPVPSKVLRRAQHDDRFAMHLVMSRERPNLLELHFADARNESFEHQPVVEAEHFSTLQLAGKVTSSLAKWGATGFKKIDPAVAEMRMNECLGCPNLGEAPDRLIYKVALIKRSDPRVCKMCGCVASTKVKVPTEQCPIGRWGAVDAT